MFDIRWIRENPGTFNAGLARRGLEPVAERIVELDHIRRSHITRLQDAQSRRKLLSKEIGQARQGGSEADLQPLLDEIARLKILIGDEESEERKRDDELKAILAAIPNIPLDDVPSGVDERDNVQLRLCGDKPAASHECKEHFEIGDELGLMDFEAAVKMSGARFVILRGALARLERAVTNFMIDLHTEEFGYTEISPPFLVRDHAMFGTGQLPKFSEDQYCTVDGSWLIPTAEVPLTNLVRETILREVDLPLRLTAATPCFRAEAGAAGRDTRGMIRQHQFSKVELVSIVTPEKSSDELDRMCACAEEVLKRLDLHYRVMILCAGDMGFSARKTYDLEVWLPGQRNYREISSCSFCGDFQARRMDARYRPADGAALRHVHTLNGSGVAVGRLLVAILENYQCDGKIVVPDALRPYMGGMDHIARCD